MSARLLPSVTPLKNLKTLTQTRLLRCSQKATFKTAPTSSGFASPVLKAGQTVDGSYVKGTINDPTTFPPPNKAHGSIHWTFERSVAASLIPLTTAALVSSQNPILDGVLGVVLVAHSHMGFDQIVIDYLPKRKFAIINPIAKWSLRALTCGVLVGVYQFNTHDIGMSLIMNILAAQY
ncbi:hypothetical protein O181_030250 [Austropuccinia psidii MF-1]|uniref:Succinate dehydrogenase [ubiquinone] cytochrome b small subunit n=1 Tax=Austropuccinia psidii MF-1 TaxID=1389203 RepID=A0A9Q3CWV3_9BASI|nr:hypothetical protein [Austropuccinia psidii MF-1]